MCNRRYVVSGANSMIGRAVVKQLLAEGAFVVALVYGAPVPFVSGDSLVVVQLPLSEYAAYHPDLRADAFLHFAWCATVGAAREDTDLQLSNVRYTLDAVDLAKRFGCTVFVGAGSQAEYGQARVPLCATTETNPQSGYGIAKYAAGKLSRLRCKQYGMRQNWARILSVYGENAAPQTLLPYLIRALAVGDSPCLTPCEQIWDFLYVTDAAAAMLAIAEKGKADKVYVVGSGVGRPLAAYVETVRDMVAPGMSLAFGTREYPLGQPMFLVADCTEITEDTGWKPRVSFTEGIARMLSAYGIKNEDHQRGNSHL